jgi:hypothetical protein
MPRKILFVLFADDECRQFHALWYALDLNGHGHDIRLLLEGPATRLTRDLEVPGSALGEALRRVQAAGLLAGACFKASCGCGTDATDSESVRAAKAQAVPLLDGMGGHAAIEPFVREGYEIVVI